VEFSTSDELNGFSRKENTFMVLHFHTWLEEHRSKVSFLEIMYIRASLKVLSRGI
jgi:hypothetical protein